MGEEDREAHRRVDRLHHADDPFRRDHEAAFADARSRAGAERDREVVGAAAALQRLRGDEAPLQLAAEAEDLAQPVIVCFERRNAGSGKSERVAAELLTLGREIRAAPLLGAALQPHERRDQ